MVAGGRIALLGPEDGGSVGTGSGLCKRDRIRVGRLVGNCGGFNGNL